jgi:hypothetical protein
MKSVLSFILVMSLSIPGYGSDCPQAVTLLNKGNPAPCTGFLFSPEAEKQTALDNMDAKYYKLLSEKLTDKNNLLIKQTDILDKRIDLYINQSNVLSTELAKREKDDDWKKSRWFSLGVVATGIAIVGAAQLLN